MRTNKIVKFVLAATTGSLMLAAASGASFASPSRPTPRPPAKPMCDASCQANKAKPPVKLQPGKSTGASNTGAKGLRQR